MAKEGATIYETSESINDFIGLEESIEVVYKISNDEFIFTTKGIYIVNVIGVFKNKKQSIKFYPYKSIEGFLFETSNANNGDIEVDILVRSNMSSKKYTKSISFNIKKKYEGVTIELLKEIKEKFL